MDNATGLNIEEFYDILWNEVSENIVPTLFIYKNSDYIDSITFDLFRIHNMTSGIVTIRHLARIVESMLGNYLKTGLNI